MPIRYTTLLALFILLCSCQHSVDQKDINAYVEQPSAQDTTCINAVKQAKTDIKKGKMKFFIPLAIDFPPPRQEKYIRQLCARYNLTFNYAPVNDMVFIGQTNGCYEVYMNKIVAKKFGADFRKNLLQKADSMLLASHDTLWSYQCDKKPQLINMPAYNNRYVKLDSTLKSKLKPDKDGDLPYMDVRYIIDTTGRVSGYLIEQFYNFGTSLNEEYKPQLFKAAVAELSRFKHGQPGQINNRKFATFNNIRVVFK